MFIVRRNIIANYMGAGWMAGITLVTVPLYLRLLGAEQWGLIAACLTLQATMNMLELGLSQIVPREIAASHDGAESMARLVRVFALLYLVGAIAGAVLILYAADWLAHKWLNLDTLSQERAAGALRILSIQFFFQFSNQCHISYWMGTQQQHVANMAQAGFLTLKHLLAVSMLFLVAPTIEVYLYSFASVAVIEWITNRSLVWRTIPATSISCAILIADTVKLLRKVRYMSAAVVAGMFVSQLDKILLSRMVSIELFGFYAVASFMGMALLQLQYPVFSAYYPVAVRAHAALERTAPILKRMALLLFLTTILPAILLAIFSDLALRAWTGDADLAMHASGALSVIAIAVVINTIYVPIYLDMLAHQAYQVVLFINGVAALVACIMLPILVDIYGIAAGGIAWFSNNLIAIMVGMLWLSRTRTGSTVRPVN